jgi:hypothetical protein
VISQACMIEPHDIFKIMLKLHAELDASESDVVKM